MSAPCRRVATNALSGSTAKCTTARLVSTRSCGSRPRYCTIAWSTFWPVFGFFSSTVATGIPLTNSAMSTDWFGFFALYRSCRATDRTFASYSSSAPAARVWPGRK